MIRLHTVQQNSPEWYALREGNITASSAHLLLSKGVTAATAGLGSGRSGYWGNRGHMLEPEALEIYEAVTGIKLEYPGFVTNNDYPGCGYSPDAIGTRPVEVKAFKEEKHLRCINGDVPHEVYCQIQFGIMICEAQDADSVFYNPSIEDNSLCFKIIRIPRDNKLIGIFERKIGVA